MTTAKQLAKYFANNTIEEREVEQRLNAYHNQCVEEGIESMHRFWLSVKKRRNSLRRRYDHQKEIIKIISYEKSLCCWGLLRQ